MARLPADLPENWTQGQIISPNGTEVGLTEQHGYNYLMKQVNAAQRAANTIAPSFDNLLAWPGCRRITPPKDEASGSYTETIVNKATNALRAKRVTVQNGESDYTETYFFYEEDGETLQAKYVVHTTKDTTETWTEDVTKEAAE